MVIESLSDWLRLFLLLGIPGILLALFLAWLTGRTSRFLQGAGAREAGQTAQRKVLGGRALVQSLTFPRYNRALVYFLVGFAVLMLFLWLGKLVQLLLF